MKTRHRAYAYVTHRNRLLVFAHPLSPEVGIQVPGGTIETGEEPAAAVLREAREETGLRALTVSQLLGHDTRDMRDCGKEELQYRWFFHLTCDDTPPETWSHGEFDDSGKLLHPFDFSWAHISDGIPILVANSGDMIPQLFEALKKEPNQALQPTGPSARG